MEELNVFLAVVEEKGFSAAAARLETTPASISRRIKVLEGRLGVRLLQRTTRRVQLTEAGEIYYQEVRRQLNELRSTEEFLRHLSSQAMGDLRISAPMSFGQRQLAPLVSAFALAHPQLKVTVRLDDYQTDLLQEGIDLALRITYPVDSSYIARPIMTVARYLCAAPTYLAKKGTPEHPTDLLRHDCLHYNVITEADEWSFDGPDGLQTVSVNGRFCSNNGDVLLEAALQGLGIALLPEFIISDALADGRLVRVLEGQERKPLTLYATYPSRHFVPAKVRLFIDYILKALNQVSNET